MNKVLASLSLLACALAVVAIDARPAAAQGINIGGFKAQKNKDQSNNQTNNRNGDDDDENANDSNNQSGRRSRSKNQSGDSSVDQIQQFFPGGQNNKGLNNQSGSSTTRRSNQQGFPGNQQNQNWQQGNQNTLTIGNWNGGKWQGTHDSKKWTQALGGNQQPFSNQWYKDHPKAWKYNNNQTTVWVGGTLPGVYSWLGWGNVPQQYRRYYGNNVQQYDNSHYGDWYPLGVFSLMTGPGDPGTRIVQLAVDQHGHIAGNYYDMISNSNYSLSGDIRQQSQRVSWSLNKNPSVRFRASLYELLQPYGPVNVQLPGGEQQWQFVRLED